MAVVLEIVVLFARIFWYYLLAFMGLFYKQKKSIAGRTALVTGGAGGIGKCLAIELLSRNAKVVLWDINKTAVEKVRDELLEKGFSNVSAFQCDVTRRDDVRRAAAETRAAVGDVELLFNNAGILIGKDLLDLSEEDIRRTMDINTISLFWTIQEFLPAMLRKNYGHIINTASMAGRLGTAMLSDYCASKFAVIGLSDSLRLEICRKKKDVKVTSVCPFFVYTPLLTNMSTGSKCHSRFDKFVEPADCAKLMVEGMLRNDFFVYVPPAMFFKYIVAVLLPRRVTPYIEEFAQTGIFPIDQKFQ